MLHDNIDLIVALVCSLTSTLAIAGAAWLLLFRPEWLHTWPHLAPVLQGRTTPQAKERTPHGIDWSAGHTGS